MPRKGTEERGVADSQLHMLHKDLLLNKDFIGLVDSAKKLARLSDLEKGIVRVLDREIHTDAVWFLASKFVRAIYSADRG